MEHQICVKNYAGQNNLNQQAAFNFGKLYGASPDLQTILIIISAIDDTQNEAWRRLSSATKSTLSTDQVKTKPQEDTQKKADQQKLLEIQKHITNGITQARKELSKLRKSDCANSPSHRERPTCRAVPPFQQP